MTTNPEPLAIGELALPAVAADLFVLGDAQSATQSATLLGGHCPSCRSSHYPWAERCPSCLGALERRPIGGSGRLYSYTVVRTKAPFGLPEPYAVGYVDLDDSGLRVFALFDPARIAALELGGRVELAVRPLGTDNAGAPCLRPVFHPASEPKKVSTPT